MKIQIVKPDAKLHAIPESITPKGYGTQYYLKSDTVEIDLDRFYSGTKSSFGAGATYNMDEIKSRLEQYLKSKLEKD